MAAQWTSEVLQTDGGQLPFERFAGSLTDFKFVALDAAIEHVLLVRGLELSRTEWLKPLGEGLFEFRIRHDGSEISRMFSGGEGTKPAGRERVLLRVFVHFFGERVVLLIDGYDKGADPSPRRQQREISDARKLLRQFRDQRRRERRPQ
jgi:hypothetical protein